MTGPMTYDPYAAQDKNEARAERVVAELNLPDGWCFKIAAGLKALALVDTGVRVR